MDGVPAIFDVFSDPGLPIGLCSSSPAPVIDATLACLGVAGRISVRHSAEDEPYGKPHPGAYLTTAARLGVSPGGCLVFEDSFPGALAGKSAGMTVVAVPAPKQLNDPLFGFCDLVIPSLAQFDRAAFDALSRRRFPAARP